MTLSTVLHLSRLPEGVVLMEPAPVAVSDLDAIVFDADVGRAVLGQSPMQVTAHGVAFPLVDAYGRQASGWRSAASHQNQVIAVMAERGESLDRQILIDGREFSLRDVLADSLAQFYPGQEEIAWAAEAYATYLPPLTAWTNRFGESVSFDQIAEELLARPLGEASCRGFHVVSALTCLLQKTGVHGLLNEEVRRRVHERLVELANKLASNQGPDGAWPADWWSESATGSSDLLATVHALEWLRLTAGSDVTAVLGMEQRESAAEFVTAAVRLAGEEDLDRDMCAYSHAWFLVHSWNETGLLAVAAERGDGG